MAALPLLPDGALGAPRYDCRRPSLAPRIKLEDNVSPKSVIADIRFISPASSSSSSMDHRPLSDANHVKLQQPRHDRGYSISDGESSDQDTMLESSRELNKVCAISRSLESLPETHSLALKATRTNISRGEGKLYQSAALLPTIEDKHQIQQSKSTSQQLLTLSGHTSAQAGSISFSSADIQTGLSGSGQLNLQNEFSSQDASALNRFDEENKLSCSVRSPVDYPGTPIRLFPGWQAQLRSPGGSHISFGSPGVEKGTGSYSPASLAEHLSRGISFQHRFLSGPLQGGKSPRPPPSKWDDAEKWIVSPGHHETSPQPQLHRPTAQALPSGRRHSISGNCHRPNFGLGSPEFITSNAEETPLFPTSEHTNGRGESLTRNVSQKKRSKTLSFGDLSKRVFDISCSNTCETTKVDDPVAEVEESSESIDQSNSHETQRNDVKELGKENEVPSNVLPSTKSRERGSSESLENDKSKPRETARRLDDSMDVETLKHALTESMKETDSQQQQSAHAAGPPPPSEHSWKFGRRTSSTESHRNSRPTTPVLTASPTRHNTPARSGRRPTSFGSLTTAGEPELQTCQFAKFELSNLGDDARNIAWITREEEDMECSASLRDNDSGVLDRAVYDEKTAAQWEEAEQTEDSKRCDKEEARIKAWEELQTSKAEAEMQKLELKIEKMRLRALEKMSNRIALARKKAKEMRASADVARANQTTKTTQQAKPIHEPILSHVSAIPKSAFKCCFKA
ncbi:hypothetical protein KC19_7G034000 [Ceratodon purpureus]|uniref:Remorin C-terminal domain-containing protein n=1 Tax=Ceratodon purpureus TaxID=3225 RepID=A0A8T0H5J3_CERPU|nr:hypothetical protein KC19_7G034000 [Ceratodon purpureus]